eukprot:Anaeramoba_flamelloidesc34354_g2_i1.p1 GENE.c34354_g2_i1~~c34354_g2_i1.p1  ORF type:complete len:343 (+),score=76.76 c34354_g2_i1:97-1029(+)
MDLTRKRTVSKLKEKQLKRTQKTQLFQMEALDDLGTLINSSTDSGSDSDSVSVSVSDSDSDSVSSSRSDLNSNSNKKILKGKKINSILNDNSSGEDELKIEKKIDLKTKKKKNVQDEKEDDEDNLNYYVGVSEMNLSGLNDLPSLYKILKLMSKAAKKIKAPLKFPDPKKIDIEIVLKQLALSIGKADFPPMNLQDIDENIGITEFEEEDGGGFTQVFKPAKDPIYLELTFTPKIPEMYLKLYPEFSKKDYSKYLSLQMAWMMRGISLSYNAPIFLSQVYEHDVYYKKTTAGGWANSFGIGSAGKEPKNK